MCIPYLRTLALAALLTSPACGQGYFDVRMDKMERVGTLSSTAIFDITFVIPSMDEKESIPADRGLATVASPQHAIALGRPSPEMNKLLTRLLGVEHRADLNSATLLPVGDGTFLWKLSYDLFPKTGGFSGIPFKWRAAVTHQGALIEPHLYLQSHFGDYFAPEQTVFCTLPMSSLNPRSLATEHPSGAEIAKDAVARLHSTLKDVGIGTRFRVGEVVLRRFPEGISGIGADASGGAAWEIRLIEIGSEGDEESEFVVWANSTGEIGTFTIGHWTPVRK